MKNTLWLCAPLLLGALAVPAAAADEKPGAPGPSAEDKAMMQAMETMGAVGPNHKLLEPMVGTWDVSGSFWMKPGAPPMASKGTSVNKSILGGRFVQQDYTSEFMGQPFIGLGMSGYDNLKKQFVNTWIDNMGTAVMVSYGSHDPATRTFTYQVEMDDPMKPGAQTKLREVVRIIDNDKHVFEMFETRDGKEAKSMELTYTRKK